jgi:osmotically-inducible protein OsmY
MYPLPNSSTANAAPFPDIAASAIAARAKLRLDDLAFPQLRNVVCDYQQGVLALRGRLESLFLQQLAHDAVRDIDGVEEIIDRLDVRHHSNHTK